MTQKSKRVKKESLTTVDDVIFEKFRALRAEIAAKDEVPAYIVFSDKTLVDFIDKLPQTKDEILGVNGVGEVKYERYGEEFLALCREIKSL